MSELIVILTVLIISAIGFVTIKALNLLPKKDTLSVFAYSYGLGVGLVAFQLYIYARVYIPWQWEFIFSPWIILCIVAFLKNRKKIHFSSLKISNFDTVVLLLLLGIVISVGYTAFEALLRPTASWDVWATWLLKSKVFFIDGTIKPEVFNYILIDYPLVINLLGTFVYFMLGHIDDRVVLLTSTAFYIFSALLLFCMLKKKYSAKYALIFTFLLVTTQNFVRHGGRLEAGMADLPLGYYALICTDLLFDYLKKGSWRTLLLLNIFLGITGLIKFEGIPLGFVIAFCALFYIYKNKLYKHLLLFVFWLVPLIDWQIYEKIHQFQDTYFTVHKFSISLPKTIHAFTGTAKEFINIKSWNLLWIIYFYTLFAFGFKKNKELALLNLIILSQLGVYLVIYIFTTSNSPETSIERLLIHLAPLTFYYIAIVADKTNIFNYL
jgi:hypothetical protein